MLTYTVNFLNFRKCCSKVQSDKNTWNLILELRNFYLNRIVICIVKTVVQMAKWPPSSMLLRVYGQIKPISKSYTHCSPPLLFYLIKLHLHWLWAFLGERLPMESLHSSCFSQLYTSNFNKQLKQFISRGRTCISSLKTLLGKKRLRAWWLKIDN